MAYDANGRVLPLKSHSCHPLQLVCPLLRCVGNLSTSCPAENLSAQVADFRIVAALCAILQAFLQTRPALARESAWVLNNLTGFSLHVQTRLE